MPNAWLAHHSDKGNKWLDFFKSSFKGSQEDIQKSKKGGGVASNAASFSSGSSGSGSGSGSVVEGQKNMEPQPADFNGQRDACTGAGFSYDDASDTCSASGGGRRRRRRSSKRKSRKSRRKSRKSRKGKKRGRKSRKRKKDSADADAK